MSLLKRHVYDMGNTCVITSAASLKNLAGILSRPVALEPFLFLSFSSTTASDTLSKEKPFALTSC